MKPMFIFSHVQIFFMPSNKNARFRYRVIDACLCNRGRQWSLADLHRYVEKELWEQKGIESISVRQIQGDISEMRKPHPVGHDAPIKCKNGKYFYTDPHFSIRKNPLVEKDLHTLREALDLLQPFQEFPHFSEMELMIAKLERRLKPKNYRERKMVQFEYNPNLKGREFIKPLYEAIVLEQCVELHYHPFYASPICLIVHPYLLKEYNNRWFLLALTEEERAIWTFPLDRIVEFKVARVDYFPPQAFKAEYYFQHIIGVTVRKEEVIQDVHIKLSKSRAPYLETKPLHPSQTVLERLPNGEVVFALRLLKNNELVTKLLSYGADLEVLQPLSLREEMKEILERAWKKYL